jgi:AcrR family transcriptional regulator
MRDKSVERSAKARLLAAAVEHFSAEGLGDQSLRQIAAAVGTSHRMLLYHFGSKDGLLVEVAQAVEARTRAQFEEVSENVGGATDAIIRRMWVLLADPAVGDFERLFFALYGRGLQGEEGIRPLLEENIEGWIEANVEQAARVGIPEDIVRVHARLGLAVTRGLLMDLLATGDRPRVDAAMEAFARNYAGRWWEVQPAVSAKRVGSSLTKN